MMISQGVLDQRSPPLGSHMQWHKEEDHFPIGILGQVWYLIVSILDLCTLLTFYFGLQLNQLFHTGKCIRRFGGTCIYAYRRYLKDRKW